PKKLRSAIRLWALAGPPARIDPIPSDPPPQRPAASLRSQSQTRSRAPCDLRGEVVAAPAMAAISAPASTADSSQWDELRREARRLEGDLDVRLSAYAKLGGYSEPRAGAVADQLHGGAQQWRSVEMEIESLLEKLLDVNEAMSRCAAAAAVPSLSVNQKLTRHRDILHEFNQEFRRIKGNIKSMREHAELLTSVRNDINEYKASGSLQSVPNLLRERAAIHGSIVQIDEVTNRAEEVKGALAAQRNAFSDIQGKVKQLGDRFPVIRGLLGILYLLT
ncbi:hypothetical protein Taro_050286, partial [Colocasia esculenta]|nr:hypothetical protein [Colocasia esculenta]